MSEKYFFLTYPERWQCGSIVDRSDQLIAIPTVPEALGTDISSLTGSTLGSNSDDDIILETRAVAGLGLLHLLEQIHVGHPVVVRDSIQQLHMTHHFRP